jgi:two-component system response regulator DesR
MKTPREGKLRVFLADDQAKIRWALRTFLQEEPRLILVGETSEAEALLALVEATHPDLLLLDWELPGRPIIELLCALQTLDSQLKVIVLSSQPEAQQAALAAGVAGFVSKNDPPEQLLTTLHAL